MHPQAPIALTHRPAVAVAPVEYAVAVDAYLAGASLSESSRRIYRISLTSWTWSLVGKPLPEGRQRRGAAAPVVPLALLDSPGTASRLAAAVAARAAVTDVRTVNRELSALRSAVGWWQDRQWIRQDPTAGLCHLASPPAVLPPLTDRQLADLFRAPPSLREHAFWRVIYESSAAAEHVLALDAGDIDLHSGRGRIRAASPGGWERTDRSGTDRSGTDRSGTGWNGTGLYAIAWGAATNRLLGWLLAGRAAGPVFMTDRRAPAHAPPSNVCPVTGRSRMSYRRAAEIFLTCTRPLDPAGRGWTLHQLRPGGPGAAGARPTAP